MYSALFIAIQVSKCKKAILIGPNPALFGFCSCKNVMESIHGLMSQVIKDRLFNQIGVQALKALPEK